MPYDGNIIGIFVQEVLIQISYPMMTKPSLTCVVRTLIAVVFLFTSLFVRAQSESKNMVTYDTVYQSSGIIWQLRITRPANMFTPGSPDTASRPVIFSMPGIGEIGTNPAVLQYYGPHYWLANGWDGGVLLGNGMHYPILITLVPNVKNVRPQYLLALMQYLLNTYHIKRNSVHVAGLSMGGFAWSRLITYAAYAGDHTAMSMIRSFAGLEGTAAENFNGVSWGYAGFAEWAAKYNGQYFGISGSTSDVGLPWIPRDSMAAKGYIGNAYFATVTFGGGGHCCWNSEYNPYATNWGCVPIQNPNITNDKSHPNSQGNYIIGSLFQWMLRQGDTTLVASQGSSSTTPPVVSAGANQTITLPTNSVTLTGSATAASGATISSYNWTLVSGPSGSNITTASSSSTTVTNLTAGTYVYRLTVTDDKGNSSYSDVSVQVKPAPIPPTVNAGADQHITLPANSITLSGTATANGGATIVSTTWSEVSGPSGYSITSANNVTTSVSGLVAGTYIFRLTVRDNNGSTSYDDITVLVSAAPVPPTVTVCADITITLPLDSATLSGSATGNGGATINIIAWTEVAGPSSYLIGTPSKLSTLISNLAAGSYTFRLTATDNNGNSSYKDVNITVNPQLVAPTVNAGANQSIILPVDSVLLKGTATANGGASIVSTTWSEVSGPSGYSITSANNLTTAITQLIAGTYVFRLTAIDTNGDSSSSDVTIIVNPALMPPMVSAGPDITITLPVDSVQLKGTASGNGGATVVKVNWTFVNGPGTYAISSPDSLTTIIGNLQAGTYTFRLTATDNNGNSSYSNITVNVAIAINKAPVANAGADKSITLPVDSVLLIGSAIDQDGTIVSYEWSKISGPAQFKIDSSSQAKTEINNLIAGIYQFQLKVTDNAGATAMDTVQVTVNAAVTQPPPVNKPPVAIAGNDQSITLPVNSVLLTGSGNDSDGTIVTYRWTMIAGPAQYQIVSAGQAQTNVTNLVQGTYVFQLQVTDNQGAIGTDTMRVVVNAAIVPPANQPPVANAGIDQVITLPLNTVTLKGSGSDADGSVVSYLWTKISGPSSSIIIYPDQPQTDITNLSEGVYQFQLEVWDNQGAIAFDTVNVTVNAAVVPPPPPNQPPVANAGLDQVITLPSDSLLIIGSGTDVDGTVVSYHWTKISGPDQYLISDPGQPQVIINNLVQGVYEFQLAVTDNKGAVGLDTMKITVNPALLVSFARLYPNPATSVITVEIDAATKANNTNLFIYDASGVLVYQEQFVRDQQKIYRTINVSNFAKGVYFVKTGVDINNYYTIPFVKQ